MNERGGAVFAGREEGGETGLAEGDEARFIEQVNNELGGCQVGSPR
jgi:hypothetical protein